MSHHRTLNRIGLARWLPLLPVALGTLLIGANAGDLGGWLVLVLLIGTAAISTLTFLLLSLRQWRRPFTMADLGPLFGYSFASAGNLDEKVSPLEVELALRDRLGEWARELSKSEAATVLFHRSRHADYDLRIVSEDGEETERWVCLIQAKARPLDSTIRHLARVKEREDAQDAVLVTVPLWAVEEAHRLRKAAEAAGVQVASLEELDRLLHGTHPTVEVYVETPPPAEARVPVNH
jgi:hypothetical protein